MRRLPVLIRREQHGKLTEIIGAGCVTHGHNAIMWLKSDDDQRGLEIRGDARILTKTLKSLVEKLEMTQANNAAVSPRLQANYSNWDWLTPQMVIEKFEQSPALQPHAADVKTALAGYIFNQPHYTSDVDRVLDYYTIDKLIDRHGNPYRGAQAKIARALQIKNAGSYRERILGILGELQQRFNSTTTHNSHVLTELAA